VRLLQATGPKEPVPDVANAVQDTKLKEPVPPHDTGPGVAKLAHETGPKEPVPPAEMPPVADSCVAAMTPLAVRLLHATGPKEPVPVAARLLQETAPGDVRVVQDTGPNAAVPPEMGPGVDRLAHVTAPPKDAVPPAEMPPVAPTLPAKTALLAVRLTHVMSVPTTAPPDVVIVVV